jgi:hypothetical protein
MSWCCEGRQGFPKRSSGLALAMRNAKKAIGASFTLHSLGEILFNRFVASRV